MGRKKVSRFLYGQGLKWSKVSSPEGDRGKQKRKQPLTSHVSEYDCTTAECCVLGLGWGAGLGFPQDKLVTHRGYDLIVITLHSALVPCLRSSPELIIRSLIVSTLPTAGIRLGTRERVSQLLGACRVRGKNLRRPSASTSR